jgi:hypothetical protein
MSPPKLVIVTLCEAEGKEHGYTAANAITPRA